MKPRKIKNQCTMYVVVDRNGRYWNKDYGAVSFPAETFWEKYKAHEYLGMCLVKFSSIQLFVTEVAIIQYE